MKEKINEPIYTLTGIVIHGRGIGKHVGTPTANIEIKTEAIGIYFSAAFCFHAIGLCFLSGRCKH